MGILPWQVKLGCLGRVRRKSWYLIPCQTCRPVSRSVRPQNYPTNGTPQQQVGGSSRCATCEDELFSPLAFRHLALRRCLSPRMANCRSCWKHPFCRCKSALLLLIHSKSFLCRNSTANLSPTAPWDCSSLPFFSVMSWGQNQSIFCFNHHGSLFVFFS